MQKIFFEKIRSDVETSKLEGVFFDEKDFLYHITEDCDGYTWNKLDGHIQKTQNEPQLLFKFRRGCIPNEMCTLAIKNFEKPAKKKNYNRGASAGLLNNTKLPSNITEIQQTEKFRAKVKYTKGFSNYQIGNLAMSNIVGYYDDPKMIGNRKSNVPCRKTQFTRDHPKVWGECVTLIEHIDTIFQKTNYDKWKVQYEAAQATDFRISNTSFSTITLNHNFRTALHRDKGDFKNGFGNLCVFRTGNWQGNYLGLYQYGVCIHIDHGDYLTFDVHQWHCNTEMCLYDPIKDMRLSMVLYLRENIIKKCVGNQKEGSKKYLAQKVYKRVFYDREENIKELFNYSKAHNLIKDDSFLKSKIICCILCKDGEYYSAPIYFMGVLEYFVSLEAEAVHHLKYMRVNEAQQGGVERKKFFTMNANYCLVELLRLFKLFYYEINMVILTKKNNLCKIHINFANKT